MRFVFRYALVVVMACVLAAASLAALADGRINVVHHFGGDVVYCVDATGAATNDYAAMLADGGLQVLAMNGDLLLSVTAEAVTAAVAHAQPGEGNLLVAEGQGTHGPAAIYVYKTADGAARFIFVGVDEHGESNQVHFEHCLPVNPPVDRNHTGGASADMAATLVPRYAPAGCYYHDVSGKYMKWLGNVTQQPVYAYHDDACTNEAATLVNLHVSAPDADTAQAYCGTRPAHLAVQATETGEWPIFFCWISP